MIKSNPPASTTSAREVSHIGKQIYERLREQLEANHPGKFVAIEVESGDYFVGETLREANQKAKEKHPHKIFYAVKVGSPAVYSFSSGASVIGPSTTTLPYERLYRW